MKFHGSALGSELFTRPFPPSPFSPRPYRKGLGTKLTLELEACSKTGPERVVLVRNLPVQWLWPCARARRVSRDELVDKLGELSWTAERRSAVGWHWTAATEDRAGVGVGSGYQRSSEWSGTRVRSLEMAAGSAAVWQALVLRLLPMPKSGGRSLSTWL